MLFGRFVELSHAKNTIAIGSGVVLNDFVCLEGGPGENPDYTLTIEDNAFIGTGTAVKVTAGNISIGAGTNIGSDCRIQSDLPVVFEKNVLVAAFCEIGKLDQEKHQVTLSRGSDESKFEQETCIRQGGWLGVRTKIKAGCHIGAGTIVGAHSTAVTDLPENVVAIGDPARVLRSRILQKSGPSD